MSLTRKQIEIEANRLGIYVDTYSPGDGITRFRFMPTSMDYFASSNALATCLGRGEASTWLEGYRAGVHADRPTWCQWCGGAIIPEATNGPALYIARPVLDARGNPRGLEHPGCTEEREARERERNNAHD